MSTHVRTVIVFVLAGLLLARAGGPVRADTLIDFEDLFLDAESFYNGEDGAGGFTSRGARFNNRFTDFGGFTAWDGWAYSNFTDVSTPGFANQYSAFSLTAPGGDGSPNYAVAFTPGPNGARIELPPGLGPLSAKITNTTYAALSLLEGDAFAKRFGGESGADPDWFRLTIQGFDGSETLLGTVDFFLADYRSPDPAEDYVVDRWTTVDLSELQGSSVLGFSLASSDVGEFGMNTPAYFALDNLLLAERAPPLTADFNRDGRVDLADFLVLKAGFGKEGDFSRGDADGNRQVDLADFSILKSQFGQVQAAPVFEPASMALAVAAVAAGWLATGRRGRRGRCQAAGG